MALESRQPANSRVVRRLYFGGILSVSALLFCCCVTLATRGGRQRSNVEALLRFKASIYARYGDYEFQPPPIIRLSHAGSEFAFAKGRGQRGLGFSIVDDPPRFIGWIAAIFGDHCLARVTDIYIADGSFSDADVDLLLAFPDLRAIDISDSAITDAGLPKLTSIKQLESLDISGAQVSDASLRMLANCKELKELNLEDIYIYADDETIEFLQQELPDCWIRRSQAR